MKELLVSLDLELNQPSRRIIQIGAVVGNIRTGEIVSRFDSKVSPDEELSPAIAKLTKIKQEEVDVAPKLREAYECLAHGSRTRIARWVGSIDDETWSCI
jgi:DNA polymerase III epsilon subunit-like protein